MTTPAQPIRNLLDLPHAAVDQVEGKPVTRIRDTLALIVDSMFEGSDLDEFESVHDALVEAGVVEADRAGLGQAYTLVVDQLQDLLTRSPYSPVLTDGQRVDQIYAAVSGAARIEEDLTVIPRFKGGQITMLADLSTQAYLDDVQEHLNFMWPDGGWHTTDDRPDTRGALPTCIEGTPWGDDGWELVIKDLDAVRED